ncbi:MAG TPA: CGNR zinc finger domain-containing protein [Steroidobacteraceae bacterium]
MVKSSDPRTNPPFGPEDLVGGAVALDFLNTVHDWYGPVRKDRLEHFEDWLGWSQAAGLPAARNVHVSRQGALQFMRQVRGFRDDWRRLLSAELGGGAKSTAALESLNRHWQRSIAARVLRATPAGLAYDWSAETPTWERAFHAVVLSAVELLTDPSRLARVHECPADDCGWFFFDSSKNGSRRWCSMKTCGNLDKVRRFNERQRRS